MMPFFATWGIKPSFPGLFPTSRHIAYVLRTRPPLTVLLLPVRLACLIHAASVRSEPESNSPKIEMAFMISHFTNKVKPHKNQLTYITKLFLQTARLENKPDARFGVCQLKLSKDQEASNWPVLVTGVLFAYHRFGWFTTIIDPPCDARLFVKFFSF
jgi:hypothetical protein